MRSGVLGTNLHAARRRLKWWWLHDTRDRGEWTFLHWHHRLIPNDGSFSQSCIKKEAVRSRAPRQSARNNEMNRFPESTNP